MRLLLGIIGILAFLLFTHPAHAATITGTAYDGLTLEVLPNVVVSITTSPVQTVLERDGTYSFTVPPGTYTLKAVYREQGITIMEASQAVNVNADGNYIIDLILLPDLGNVPDEPLPDETPALSWVDQLARGPLIWWAMLGIVLLASGFAVMHTRKNARKEMNIHENEEKNEKMEHSSSPADEEIHLDKYALEILDHLKRGGNRTTQKELREKMSIGEAKVSLVVSELESYGFLKKIKRGRGNILILGEKGRAYAEKEMKEKNTPTSSLNMETKDEKPGLSTPES